MVPVSTSTTTTTATAMAGDDSHQSIGAGAGQNTGLKAVGNVSPGSGVGVILGSSLLVGLAWSEVLSWVIELEGFERSEVMRFRRWRERMLGYDPVTKRMDDKGDPRQTTPDQF